MRLVVLLLAWLCGHIGLAYADTQVPAGYVAAYQLAGRDRDIGTAVIREGEELKPELLMPLYDGDTVFVRDAASRLTLDLAAGGRIEIGGGRARYTGTGRITASDEAWTLITALADLVSGRRGEEIPDNLVARGDDLAFAMAMATAGPNFLTPEGGPVPLSWRGGTAPFTVIVEAEGLRMDVVKVEERQAKVPIPSKATRRFAIIVKDAKGARLRAGFRLRDRLPEGATAIAANAPSPAFGELLVAAWLVERQDGGWRIEAMRRLIAKSQNDPVAAKLLAALKEGRALQ